MCRFEETCGHRRHVDHRCNSISTPASRPEPLLRHDRLYEDTRSRPARSIPGVRGAQSSALGALGIPGPSAHLGTSRRGRRGGQLRCRRDRTRPRTCVSGSQRCCCGVGCRRVLRRRSSRKHLPIPHAHRCLWPKYRYEPWDQTCISTAAHRVGTVVHWGLGSMAGESLSHRQGVISLS